MNSHSAYRTHLSNRNNAATNTTATTTTDIISSTAFYSEYHGHKVSHLQTLLPHLRNSSSSLIWTAGDSSLDNKYWFGTTAEAVSGSGYENVLRPQQSICDVTYWLNHLAKERWNDGRINVNLSTINAAVEATTLNQRTMKLLPQDEFIRDNIKEDDILVVSIGGNDVALLPAPCTICAMAGMLQLPKSCVDNGFVCCTVPINDYCCGCTTSLLSCLGSWPPCLGYFRHLFGVRVQKYVEKLTSKAKPKKILICMIYYLDENANTQSWAGPALGAMGYNRDPSRLQGLIKKTFHEATSKINIKGSQVIPVPLFHALDGKSSRDYVARVEPSARGGKKMAEFLLDLIHGDENDQSIQYASYQSPTSANISERK